VRGRARTAALSIAAAENRAPVQPPAGRALVRLERVGKVFANGVVARDGLDLSIGEHEFVSLLGPSGCGKSTALRLIAGLSALRAGRRIETTLPDHRELDRLFEQAGHA
jgi:ABC-type Fe3+/spermidine/putrescine transport system ATPase subunit